MTNCSGVFDGSERSFDEVKSVRPCSLQLNGYLRLDYQLCEVDLISS